MQEKGSGLARKQQNAKKGKGVQPKKWGHSPTTFLSLCFYNSIFPYFYLLSLYWETIKTHWKEYLYLWDSYTLAASKNNNWTTLQTRIVNACLCMCEKECGWSLKQQYPTFSISVDMWCKINNHLFKKNVPLPPTIDCLFAMNDTREIVLENPF